MKEAIRQQSEVFSALYVRVANNMEQMTESREMLQRDEEKLSETQANRDEAAKTLEELRASMPVAKDVPNAPETVDPKILAAKDSAMAEALAALRESEQALQDAQKSYDQNKTKMEKMEESMKSMEALLQKALSDPEGVANLRNELDLPPDSERKKQG